MRIFAIGDLHLPGGDKKPMDVFGRHWENHFAHICEDWRARVAPQDVVLIPGDISWAMHLQAAGDDLRAIAQLPGQKILLRGNHDYWWSSLTQVRNALPEGCYALQNDALMFGGVLFCGTRGWTCPNDTNFTAQDEKLYLREGARLELSLKEGRRRYGDMPLCVLLHYPPFTDSMEDTHFTRLIEEYGAKRVVYGHLHGASIARAFCGVRNGVRYDLVSCDALGFKLLEIPMEVNGVE